MDLPVAAPDELVEPGNKTARFAEDRGRSLRSYFN
jgi:hypothetical protein